MNARVLPDLAAMAKMIEEQAAEIAALKAAKATPGKLTLKIGEKGGIGIYGLGRFPLTAYASQWLRVIAIMPELKAFIEANKDKLAWKD